ncbi:Lrp/AsnC ligand binding domain-containing protein [Neorhizobium galegae]|uniref:Lrp/AsnC ligand binding domain-containing protein n=1 Tax=Neorhizobium galegae TaxID=399 RepID=UPI000620E5D7|nr:Lrp/AsnC ligand binding domain-containing protein [Neorhizobium galegae]CDZ57731.1 Leucine-responsive regulatory protein [Neorhizobium galegae bv. orientalis]KAB1124533.1 winged helix-turn-helix transcriptional regulator [Neorhizobium galegae]MCQ1571518.1 Lrp/AsnC ligand binding domain-containing protein [Neorhizobium galegae]MCQ1804879.1 Lrp/AsnC ligand binding domain-containing protein [Neorhizobium galegae]UIK03920.1 Lrp/AsnC ligand binding domain-containing protein [Neorhizobium galegae
MKNIDRLDRKILRALQKEGRLSNLELADRVALSPTATAERVKRLTREGYITGYSALLSPEKLGRNLLVFVQVKLDRTTPDVFDAFAAAVKRSDDVMECHMVAGGFDYLVKARVAGMEAYRQFLSEVILPLPGVRETHTYAVMEEIKGTGYIPV